jgi:hypothetical protein
VGTITQGFWGARREINVDKSIPSMEKLLEANGRMNNYLASCTADLTAPTLLETETQEG